MSPEYIEKQVSQRLSYDKISNTVVSDDSINKTLLINHVMKNYRVKRMEYDREKGDLIMIVFICKKKIMSIIQSYNVSISHTFLVKEFSSWNKVSKSSVIVAKCVKL